MFKLLVILSRSNNIFFLFFECLKIANLVNSFCFYNLQTLSGPVNDPSKLPKWNYDGSSTGQAPGEDSEVIL